MVATNFRVPQDRGEIDLIGWDGDTLCFIEVKTRTDVSFAPPSTAVTHGKQRNITSVARRYLRRLSVKPTLPIRHSEHRSLAEDGRWNSRCARAPSDGIRKNPRSRKPRYFESRPALQDDRYAPVPAPRLQATHFRNWREVTTIGSLSKVSPPSPTT